jgi:hypothetical protein
LLRLYAPGPPTFIRVLPPMAVLHPGSSSPCQHPCHVSDTRSQRDRPLHLPFPLRDPSFSYDGDCFSLVVCYPSLVWKLTSGQVPSKARKHTWMLLEAVAPPCLASGRVPNQFEVPRAAGHAIPQVSSPFENLETDQTHPRPGPCLCHSRR